MYIIIIVLLAGYIVFSKLSSKNSTPEVTEASPMPINTSKLPYKKKEYLMSTAERSFYGVLSLILKGGDFIIFSKVRLADLLYLPSSTINRQVYWNEIQSRNIDFLICDKKHTKPLLAVELDDSSHSYPERDMFVSQALQQAGLHIVRVKAANTYELKDIEQLIDQYLRPVAEQEETSAKEPAVKTSEDTVAM